jgi:hypothetical protein
VHFEKGLIFSISAAEMNKPEAHSEALDLTFTASSGNSNGPDEQNLPETLAKKRQSVFDSSWVSDFAVHFQF